MDIDCDPWSEGALRRTSMVGMVFSQALRRSDSALLFEGSFEEEAVPIKFNTPLSFAVPE